MTSLKLCHFLIGLPNSGKSTFARQLNQQIPNSVIISSDTIELGLSGNIKWKIKWR